MLAPIFFKFYRYKNYFIQPRVTIDENQKTYYTGVVNLQKF